MVEIVVYGYPASPYYQKLLLTLNFLRLPHVICAQPRVLPRPDMSSVGITYRRIPLLSIDGHMYADTNLIISKLCALAGVPNDRETEALGNAMFGFCAMLIPFKLVADETFLKDRSELTGRPWTETSIRGQRPFALSQFLAHVASIGEILKNGGGFVKGGKVTMADIHIAFVVQWVLLTHKGAEPEVSPQTHGALYAWLEQVQRAVDMQKADKISFADAKKSLLSARPSRAPEARAVPDPLGLTPGSKVTVVPIDTGRTHPQGGRLVYTTEGEVCLETEAGVQISFPQAGYMVSRAKEGGKL